MFLLLVTKVVQTSVKDGSRNVAKSKMSNARSKAVLNPGLFRCLFTFYSSVPVSNGTPMTAHLHLRTELQ